MKLLHKLTHGLLSVMRQALGEFHWTAPTWLRRTAGLLSATGRRAKRRPVLTLLALCAVTALGIGSWKTSRWWKARPKPHLVEFQIFEPSRTEIENEDETQRDPKPLRIVFQESVAPLTSVGLGVSGHIRLDPTFPGVWTWQSDRVLNFLPQKDWPLGSTYEAHFSPSLFKPGVKLARNAATFKAPSFNIQIAKAEFYQDPQRSELKKAVVHLAFSYPVNPAELEKRLELKLGGKDKLKFTVTYDPLKLKAFIQSEVLAIPQENTAVDFKLAKGTISLRGGKAFAQDLQKSITVPGLYSLNFLDLDTQVVTNDKDEPEQVLVLDASAELEESEINKALSVWLLPTFALKAKPDETEPFAWTESDVTPEVLKKSTKLVLEAIPHEEAHSKTQSYKYRADVGAKLFVQIKEGVSSFGGYRLAKDFVRVVEVPPYPSDLKIMSQGALLALSGEKKIGLMSRDLPGLKIEIGRVLPSQIQHLVSQSYGSYATPEFESDFNSDNIVERFEKRLPLPALQRGKAHYESLDLSDYLRAPGAEKKRGVFLLSIQGYDPAKEAKKAECEAKKKRPLGAAPNYLDFEEEDEDCRALNEGAGENDPESFQDGRMLLVTDLGILVKTWLNGTQEVYVQSIYSGRPVAGAKVEILGENGVPLFSHITDAQGRARFAKIENLSREHKPTLILVEKGSDLSFMPMNLTKAKNSLDFSRFDVDGASNARVPDQVSAFLFSDRGIYRPGDTFHIGMIVKPARWETKVTGLPVWVEVLDSKGTVILSEKKNLPAGGFLELSHSLEESAPEGSYDVDLYLAKDDDKRGDAIGSTQIKVQEFLPDRMKVTAKLSTEAEGWISPEGLKAQIQAQNLFGTPAEKRRVKAEMLLKPAFPKFDAYSDYEFYDPHRAEDSYTEELGESKTDAQGKAEFDLRLNKYANATYRLSFLAEVFEPEGGRSVSAMAKALVSDWPYLIGFKADGNLDYVARGSLRKVSLIAIDPKLNKSTISGLNLQRIETRYVSVLNKQQDGTYGYESRKKEIKEPETELEIPAAGATLTLDTSAPGDFSYVLRDKEGKELNRIDYSVAGRGNVARSLDRNAELKLTLNKEEYAPGEEIEVSIRAPYVGAGLITIERDEVYAVQWFKTDTSASVQKIRIPPNFKGNGYVNVQFIRDPASDEIFMSPLSYGVVPFSSKLDHVTDRLQLSVPERIRPGESLDIRLSSAQPAKAVVFAVDEGILQVASYRLPDPLGFFFEKKMLEVRSSQILDMILPEFKKLMLASAAGGGGESQELGKYLNPFKRKREAPVVYWSGIVDVAGSREFHYPVPAYFNGSLRVMAVAVNESGIGTAETKSTVRGDLVISPNAPTTVTPGDEFEVSVGLSNNVKASGKEAAVSLTLQTPPSLEVLGETTQTLKIDEDHESVAVFRVKVASNDKVRLGSADLTFTAVLAEKSAILSTSVSIRPPTPRYNQLQMGSFSAKVDVPVQRDLYPEYRRLEAAVSFSPLVLASGLAQYLGDYEHLCTEQLVSQAMAALVLAHRPEFGKANAASPRSLNETFNILRTRQNTEGGFGAWVASVQADEFASVYVVHLLIEAQARGETVPSDLSQKGTEYLQKLAARPAQNLWELRDRSYAAYLLTRQALVTTPILTSLRETLENRYPKEWKSDLAGIYLAASYQMLKQQKEAESLVEAGLSEWKAGFSEKSFGYAHYYDPLIRDAQIFDLLARHFPEQVKKLPPASMEGLVKAIGDGRFNTLSAAYLILAFDAYAQALSPVQGKLGIAEIDAQGAEKPLVLPDNAIPRTAFSPEAKRLRLSNAGGSHAYFAISESGFDKNFPKTELRQGLEIHRDYLDADGKPVSSVALGDEITVRIRYRTVDRESLPDTALIDLLPGGFEPVLQEGGEQGKPALGGLSGAHADAPIQFAEAREDRVIFYGSIPKDLGELSYRIKASNAGRFQVPPAYAESMYERGVQARSGGGQVLVVERKK